MDVVLLICGTAVYVTYAGISVSQMCIKLLCHAVIQHRRPFTTPMMNVKLIKNLRAT
jgi:hypothetical protein